MAARKLENKKTLGLLLDRIAKTGIISHAIKGLCSERAYYRYYNDSNEFRQQVEAAKDNFRQKLVEDNPELIRLAAAALKRALEPQVIQWKKTEYIHRPLRAENGSIIYEQHPLITTISETIREPQKWAVQAVLGIDIDSQKEEEQQQVTELPNISFLQIEGRKSGS